MDELRKQAYEPPLMLSAKDIQKLGFSRALAYRFLNRADMPVVIVGGRKYLHRDMFLAWLAQQAEPVGEGA